MKQLKIISGILLFFCLILPTFQTIAQDNSNPDSTEATDQYVYKLKGDKFTKFEKKLEKEIQKNLDKKQEKEGVDINIKFMWNLLIDIGAMLLIPRVRAASANFWAVSHSLPTAARRTPSYDADDATGHKEDSTPG